MAEIEQLRKELNELRERVAVLERRPLPPAIGTWPKQPPTFPGTPDPYMPPPYTITCENKE